MPPGRSPEKTSPLASAIAASEAKCSIWTGSTVVTSATSGRTCATSGTISRGWFMPISKTAKRLSAGIRASVSGTPQWLLYEATEACVGPCADSTWRSASFVPVLPTEPVTATICAAVRSRAARPRRVIASRTGSGPSPGTASTEPSNAAARSAATTAAPAPLSRAARTKSCPSLASPLMAKNRSPGWSVRVSMEAPVTPPRAP